jgi:GT2 family glycosyltransferase
MDSDTAEDLSITCVIPTYGREQPLIDTIEMLLPLLRECDRVLIMDQSPSHESATVNALERFVTGGRVRWMVTQTPGKGPAVNCAALVADTDLLLFLDDDIVPSPELLERHREVFVQDDAPPSVCGQVLQPWNKAPIDQVDGFDIRFDAAYSRDCDIMNLMGGNFSIRRSAFIEMGGMDENFGGYLYRDDSEMGYRICQKFGRKIRFVAAASIRHLMAGSGGSRTFGCKNSWGDIGGSIGDYYFAIRRLNGVGKVRHSLRRFLKEPLNRYTIVRPWLIPMLYVRESVAVMRARQRMAMNPSNYIKALNDYDFQDHQPRAKAVGQHVTQTENE